MCTRRDECVVATEHADFFYVRNINTRSCADVLYLSVSLAEEFNYEKMNLTLGASVKNEIGETGLSFPPPLPGNFAVIDDATANKLEEDVES